LNAQVRLSATDFKSIIEFWIAAESVSRPAPMWGATRIATSKAGVPFICCALARERCNEQGPGNALHLLQKQLIQVNHSRLSNSRRFLTWLEGNEKVATMNSPVNPHPVANESFRITSPPPELAFTVSL